MSLLTRLRIPQSRAARPPHLHAQALAIRFSSHKTERPAKQPPNSDGLYSFSDAILDAVGTLPQRVEDNPPAAPATGYSKPNPAKPNALKTATLAPNPLRDSMVVAAPDVHMYRMYVKATRNNIIITFTRPNGDPLRTHTGGSCGFKHVNRSTHEAAHQCTVKMFKTIQEVILPKEPKMELHLLVSGFGKGRDAVRQAFLGTEGEVIRPLVAKITDKTPIKIGGNRAKKARRI